MPHSEYGISPRGVLEVLWVSEILLTGLNLFPPFIEGLPQLKGFT